MDTGAGCDTLTAGVKVSSKLLSYELNRQRNNRTNECNCRGIAVMCVQYVLPIYDKIK